MFTKLLQQRGLALDRLQSFCLVAQAGSTTAAAKGNPAKMSHFSRQVKELEGFFDIKLLRREGRGIVLTEAGERLDVLTRECFGSLLDFKNWCQGLPVGIVIGAEEGIIDWVLLPRLGEVRKKLPNLRLKFLNLDTSEVVRQLEEGVIDFGVVRKDAVARPLHSVSLGVMGYSLFVPKGLRGAGTGANALEGLPLATLAGEGSFRKELSAIARKSRLGLKIEVECASFPMVARAVGTGSVGAVLPSAAAADLGQLGAQELRIAILNSLRHEICLAWRPRALKIREALDRASKVFAQTFQI